MFCCASRHDPPCWVHIGLGLIVVMRGRSIVQMGFMDLPSCTSQCARGFHNWIPPSCTLNVRMDLTAGFPHLALLCVRMDFTAGFPQLALLVREDMIACEWISHMDSPILHFLPVRTCLCAYGFHIWISQLARLVCEDIIACVWISHMDSPILHCSSVKTSSCMRVV